MSQQPNLLAYVGFQFGEPSVCTTEHDEPIPAELMEIAHQMAQEAYLAYDMSQARVIYPRKAWKYREDECVKVYSL